MEEESAAGLLFAIRCLLSGTAAPSVWHTDWCMHTEDRETREMRLAWNYEAHVRLQQYGVRLNNQSTSNRQPHNAELLYKFRFLAEMIDDVVKYERPNIDFGKIHVRRSCSVRLMLDGVGCYLF